MRATRPGLKVSALVAGMVAGADCIADMVVLRHNLVSEVAAGRLAMAQVGTWTLSDLLAKAKTGKVDVAITTQVSKRGSAPIVPFGVRS